MFPHSFFFSNFLLLQLQIGGGGVPAPTSNYIQLHVDAPARACTPALSCKDKEMSRLCPLGF
jgi:hypothetical protein